MNDCRAPKLVHASQEQAVSHAQRLQARGEDVMAYLCAFGPEHWHVGHPRGSKRAPRALPAYGGSSSQLRKLLNRALSRSTSRVTA